jgi:putative transposase
MISSLYADVIQLGFKKFESARRTLSGIEIVRMIKKNQLIGQDKTAFKSFISLAA